MIVSYMLIKIQFQNEYYINQIGACDALSSYSVHVITMYHIM